jgi:hypothetical protein
MNQENKVTKTPTQAQLAQKARFSNVVAAYQLMAEFLRGAYEPKPHAVSYYNLFMKYIQLRQRERLSYQGRSRR